jgi:hypothetical protein
MSPQDYTCKDKCKIISNVGYDLLLQHTKRKVMEIKGLPIKGKNMQNKQGEPSVGVGY